MRMSKIILISLKNQGLRATNHSQAKLMGYLWATLRLLKGYLDSFESDEKYRSLNEMLLRMSKYLFNHSIDGK